MDFPPATQVTCIGQTGFFSIEGEGSISTRQTRHVRFDQVSDAIANSITRSIKLFGF